VLTIREKNNEEKTELETCIDGYLEYMKEIKGLCNTTIQSAMYELRRFSLFLVRRLGIITSAKLTGISSTDIMQYLAKAGAFRTKSTVFTKLSILKGFFQYAEGMGRVGKDPTRWMRGPRIDRLERLPGFLTPREVELLIHTILAVPDNRYKIKDYAIVVLFYATGIRVSELLALTIESVDLVKKLLRISSEKSRRERFVPLVPLACEALARYLEIRLTSENDSRALFLNRCGRPITNSTVTRIMKSYSKKAGLKKRATAQLLRHTCATHLLEYSHQNIEIIAKWLGHSCLDNTMIYTHISDKEAHKAVQAHPINRILKKYPPIKTKQLRKAALSNDAQRSNE
jgi:integrase/recombinase XerD